MTFWPAAGLLVALVLVLVILIGVIDLIWQSKVRRFSPKNGSVLIYFALLFLGNTFASASAFTVVRSSVARATSDTAATESNSSSPPHDVSKGSTRQSRSSEDPNDWPWQVTIMLSAFVGVFGFQAVIKNINISIYGKGFLTLDDWISKARDNAIADVIEQDTKRTQRHFATLADGLRRLPTETLNSLVVDMLGHDNVAKFEKMATDGRADAAFIKAYALAKADPVRAAAHLPP